MLERWSVELEEKVANEMADRPVPFVGDGARPVWSIDTPPPYPSGKWHIGAVAGYSLIDVIARSKRMTGHDVLFPWGTDRNGINIEFAIEKRTGRRMQDWDRAEFVAACEEAIGEYSDDMVRIAQRIGMSCDFAGGYTTDSPDYRAFSQGRFLDLFAEGLVVEDLRPNTFDPVLGTAIADAEVYYEERKTRLNHVRWEVKETGEQIEISTTRPELICACRAVLVHPENEATRHLVGKSAVLPVARRLGDGDAQSVPILAHPHVRMDFGSGIMMVCSYGDQSDVQLFRELGLEPVAAVGLDGRMTEVAGPYAGLKVEEARKAVLEDLEKEGRLAGHVVVDQKFPISERSKAPVEIILLKEWYVRQTHCADELRQVAKDMVFRPPKHRQLLLDWIDAISIDWPISRRRWYHTEIPLWFLRDGEEETEFVVVPPEGRYVQPWREGPPEGSRVLHRDTREDRGALVDFLKGRAFEVVGEGKVFDTWMDSSVSNLYILRHWRDTRWGRDHVCSVRPQGRDIVRTWLYYTTLKTWLLRQEPAFENCWIHGMGVDKHGRKMSKSLGNVIDPESIIKKHGSDAFRLWITGECTIGDDFRINEQKIQGAAKFLQKLGNVVRFVSRFPQPARPEALHPADEWILGELDATIRTAREGYDELDFFGPANAVRSFVWNLFAPHYVEMVKDRAYGDDEAACWTLHHAVRSVLHVLAPICPFISHHLAGEVYGDEVHRALLPEPLGLPRDEDVTNAVESFNGRVWRAKKEQGISLNEPIHGIDVPPDLEPMRDVLVAMHKIGVEKPAE